MTEPLPTSPPITVGQFEGNLFLRLPDRVARSVEHLLCEANRRRIDDATSRLEAMFGSIDDFRVADGLIEQPATAPAFAAEGIWRAVDEHLLLDDCSGPRLEVLAGSETNVELPCRNAYDLIRPDLGAVASCLDRELVLAVRNLDAYSVELSRLATDVETLTAQACLIDAMLCGAGSKFVDAPDQPLARVLVIAEGSIDVVTGDEPGRHFDEGSMVVIPPSMSVTVTVERAATLLRIPMSPPSQLALRALAVARAHFHPRLRADVPSRLDQPVRSYGGSLYDEPGLYGAEAEQVLTGEAMDGAVARLRSLIRPRPHHDPMTVLTSIGQPAVVLRSSAHGGVMIGSVAGSEVFAAAGHQISVADDIVDDLVPLLDGRAFSIEAVCAEAAEPERLAAAIEELCWIDLFEVQDA